MKMDCMLKKLAIFFFLSGSSCVFWRKKLLLVYSFLTKSVNTVFVTVL